MKSESMEKVGLIVIVSMIIISFFSVGVFGGIKDYIYSGLGIFNSFEVIGDNVIFKVDRDNRGASFDYNGSAQAVQIINNGSGITNNALNLVSYNMNDTTLGVNGMEKDRGTIKIVHSYPGVSDSSASGLSIELQGNGTSSQGIFINTGNSTGSKLKITNGSVTTLDVQGDGDVIITNEGNSGFLVQDLNGDDMFKVSSDSGVIRTRKIIPIVGNNTNISAYDLGDSTHRWNNSFIENIEGAYILLISTGNNNELLRLNAFDGSRLVRALETSGGDGWFGVSDRNGNEDIVLRTDGGDIKLTPGEVVLGDTNTGSNLGTDLCLGSDNTICVCGACA